MFHAKNVPGRLRQKRWVRLHLWSIDFLSKGYVFLSPCEKLWIMKPTVSYFRVFGCVCYVFVADHLRSKMDKKAIRCIFVGYDRQRKGWWCCDPKTGKCYTSWNVVFDEASSWWFSDKEALPDSDVYKGMLHSSQIQLSPDEAEGASIENNVKEDVTQSPWQTGVFTNN